VTRLQAITLPSFSLQRQVMKSKAISILALLIDALGRRWWVAPRRWRIIAATSVKNIITHAIYLCGRPGYSLSSAVVRLFPTIASLQTAARANSFDGRSAEGRDGVARCLVRLFTHISPRADIVESHPLRWLFWSLGKRRSGTSISQCIISPLIDFP
jgi:hypothetical protein